MELTKDMPEDRVIVAKLNQNLWHSIQDELKQGKLVVAMGAGTIDDWLREQLK